LTINGAAEAAPKIPLIEEMDITEAPALSNVSPSASDTLAAATNISNAIVCERLILTPYMNVLRRSSIASFRAMQKENR